jgi:hypothetical protein
VTPTSLASSGASSGEATYSLRESNVKPGVPYWSYSITQAARSRRAQSSARLTPLSVWSSTTIDECFSGNVCFVQDESDAGGSWTVICNGDPTCMSATWKLTLIAPAGATASFSPAVFQSGTQSYLTLKVPKSMAVGTSSMEVSFTQVSGTTTTGAPNSTVPIQILCSLADSTCPAIHIQDIVASPAVFVDGKTTDTAAGWPMQLKIVPTAPPGSTTYSVSNLTWSIPNTPLASYNAITGAAPVPLPSPTQSATPVFYWVYP